MGAARALEEGGSLTVIGVATDGDSEMDRVLLDDLRDVVNWELTLSRELAERGVRPPIDLHRSGTRHEERLLESGELEVRRKWRSTLTGDVLEDASKLVALAKGARESDAA
jgi:transcription termination factor Rho